MVKVLVKKLNPSNQSWLMPMTTSKDVYSYLDSFQKSARQMEVAIDEEEETTQVLPQLVIIL